MKPTTPLFLARQGYRRRRIVDAARVLPLLGIFLFFLPLLWWQGATSRGGIYLFIVWLVLIVLAAILRRLIGEDEEPVSPVEEAGK